MLNNTSRWSHTRGNTVVPYRWQATLAEPEIEDNGQSRSQQLSFECLERTSMAEADFRTSRKVLGTRLEDLSTGVSPGGYVDEFSNFHKDATSDASRRAGTCEGIAVLMPGESFE